MISAMYEEIWMNLLPPQLVTEDLTTKFDKNIVTPDDAPIPDCETCGACCGAMVCVAVSLDDNVSSEHFWKITTQGKSSEITVDSYLRRDDETLACANLEGNIGATVSCRIYETRPKMCRSFEAGSDKCHALRRAYGIEPFLTMPEMMTALQKLRAKESEVELSETIRDAKISEEPETNRLEITILMKDGTLQKIHSYDSQQETWQQYQFSGLTLAQAQTLIKSKIR